MDEATDGPGPRTAGRCGKLLSKLWTMDLGYEADYGLWNMDAEADRP